MPAAVPGVGECRICMEAVSNVKVLECGHTLCRPCTEKLVRAALKPRISCPECRTETDCSRGLGYLKTRYFGQIACDVCLEHKESEDVWWCADCVQALCSKCSIKEHARKRHSIAEWNRMEQVQFSVGYIDVMKHQRQISTESAHNETAIQGFLGAVEARLKHHLHRQPDLEDLKQNLLSRYGTRFSSDSSSTSGGSPTSSVAPGTPQFEDAPKVVAKVLQLAGVSIMDSFIPKVANQAYQISFTVTPEEVAEYLRSKIEFIPLERHEFPSAPPLPEEPDEENHHQPAQSRTNEYVETSQKRLGDPVPVLQVDYSAGADVVALRTALEVQLYALTHSKTYSIPVPPSNLIRDVCFGAEGSELLLVYQSTLKKYQWSLEAFQIATLPATTAYSAEFDIDPEDKIEGLHLSVSDERHESMYEIRLSTLNVSEFWHATISTKKSGKVKLKESMIVQRPNTRFTTLKVLTKHKERFLFAWDEMSCCLYRLLVKENKCLAATKVLHSSEQVPFCLGPDHRLWLFDPHLHHVCVSRGAVLNKANVLFDEVFHFDKYGFCGLWIARHVIVAVSLTPLCVNVVRFQRA